ncbi:MAG: hypothetical protein IPM82_01730 [Saprospiraceae bacterium]|nr:hypothetical protein [Saprospiraceae bacterium]
MAPLRAFCQATPDTTVSKKALFDLFKSDDRTELTITANFDSIKANIRNKEYESGIFEVKHSRKNSTKLQVKLRTRGKSRRMMCDFPPLKLKFNKNNLDSIGLETFNEFKLVTHCMDNERSEVNIMREYLCYQLFNVLTPYSFKANLVRVTYKNQGASFKKSTHPGIIIEDSECLAHRNHCSTMVNQIIQIDSMHSYQEKIASVFNYMIGNADWSYLMSRNTELILLEDGIVIPVPYDFDYSGIVAAPYARANAALGQRTVLDRVFLGNATSYEELKDIFSYFKSKKRRAAQHD